MPPYRVVAAATLGAASAGNAEPLHLLGMALASSPVPAVVIRRLCSTLSAILRADRCTVVEGCAPADPLFPMIREAFGRKEAIQYESVQSVLCAPLLTEKHSEGALVAERSATAPFDASALGLVATLAPQAALAIHHARVYERATSDGLTGLPNRQRFSVELEDEVAAGGGASLLLCDLDHLRDKSDVYGRAVGDRVLAELGEMLRGRLGDAAWIARTGEDEFGALLSGVDGSHARDLAEDLRKAVEDRVFDDAHERIHLTISAGVAELRAGEMPSALFTRAADALAAAKRSGRNRVESAK